MYREFNIKRLIVLACSLMFLIAGVACQKAKQFAAPMPIATVNRTYDVWLNKTVVVKGTPQEIEVSKGTPGAGVYWLQDSAGDKIPIIFEDIGSPVSGKVYLVEGEVTVTGDMPGLKEIRREPYDDVVRESASFQFDWRYLVVGGLALMFLVLLVVLFMTLFAGRKSVPATAATAVVPGGNGYGTTAQYAVPMPSRPDRNRPIQDEIPTSDYVPASHEMRTGDYHGYLEILEGPDGDKGKRFDLITNAYKSELTLGRGSDRDFQLHSGAISRKQAKFMVREGQVWISNEANKNDTMVNGERVTMRMLKTGDQISMAGVLCTVHLN